MSTKEQIIAAATHLYAEHGYEGMTMNQIAGKVGIKAPSIYAFFRSKEDVFLHIYKDTLNGHLQVVTDSAHAARHLSVKERLERLLSSIIDYQFKESVQMKIYLRLMLFPPSIVEQNLREALLALEKWEHEMLRAIFANGMERGEIKQADPDALATSMLCMMDGIFWQMQRCEEAAFRQRFEVIWAQFWESVKKQ